MFGILNRKVFENKYDISCIKGLSCSNRIIYAKSLSEALEATLRSYETSTWLSDPDYIKVTKTN